MFGGGFWASYGGTEDHLTKEREPPQRPIDLEFPEYVPPFSSGPLSPELSSSIRDKIRGTRSYLDITDQDLVKLNVHFEPNVSISSIVPEGGFSSRPFLYDDDLQAMIDEITVNNRDAFREVLRMPPLEGRQKPRLAYARNFFGSLEDMARYYDTSYDDYYTTTNTDANGSKDTDIQDQQMIDGAHHETGGTKEWYKGYRLSNAEAMNPGTRIAMTKNLLKMVMHKFQCRDHEPTPRPRESLIIRGVKIQSVQTHFCVAKIPHDMQQARARLVEGPLLGIHVRDELRFKVKDRLFTPQKTGFVGERFDFFREVGCMLIIACQRARGSIEEQKAERNNKWWVIKERWGGGPTAWGQLAHEILEEDDPSMSPHERTLREEKRRQEQLEKDNMQRVEESSANETRTLEVDDLLATPDKPLPIPSSSETRPRRKKLRSSEDEPPQMKDGKRLMFVPAARRKWYLDWQKLRPNYYTVDDKIIGRKIGRNNHLDDGFDEVYLLSSCNHHIAISKMKVHADYLSWLQLGTAVDEDEDVEQKRGVLYVTRSSWYDMFDVEARKLVLTELWRLMCWLNRDDVPEVECERTKVQHASASTGQTN